MIRVGVIGAGGRMGRQVCRAVHEQPDMALVSAIDVQCAGKTLGPIVGDASLKLTISDELTTLLEAEAEVAVDFTTPASVMANCRWAIEHAMHLVVGTTGLGPEDLEGVRSHIERGGHESNMIVAPNFAIGAVLMMHFAEIAARFMPDAEIVEMHHEHKLDAPSGTSLRTAEAISRGRAGAPVHEEAGREAPGGPRGAVVEGVHVHSVRLPGLVAHQEVILGAPGEVLTLRHDALDRASFMPGVLLAVREVPHRKGLTVGLESLLGLA
ncbi:MAG: 4-hydroxy-tetrahydrodipicolinate reductase [Actinomycetota bacterium]